MALREVELSEGHHLIFEPNGSHPCCASNCPLRTVTGPAALETPREVLNHFVGSPQSGTRVLEVPELYEDQGGVLQPVFPGEYVERWESGHACLGKKGCQMFLGWRVRCNNRTNNLTHPQKCSPSLLYGGRDSVRLGEYHND